VTPEISARFGAAGGGAPLAGAPSAGAAAAAEDMVSGSVASRLATGTLGASKLQWEVGGVSRMAGVLWLCIPP
jgi:hypothetical protein